MGVIAQPWSGQCQLSDSTGKTKAENYLYETILQVLILNIDKQCQKQDKHIQLPTTALLLTIMKGFFFFTSSIAFVLGAPQFLSEQSQSKNENCHTEVVTIFEESEAESVNKVICETEFRDSCVKKLENICNNVATGELECELVDRFNCVDSMTNKCGLESVLKNVSYTETVCDTVVEDICELEVRNGIKEPVEGSCLSKPIEKCGPVTRFTEEFVEEEVCRDIPIKDCENVQEEVCNEKKEEVCEELETESCEVVPHEECKQVVEKVPQKVSKKLTKVVCDDKESMNMETESEVPDLNDILEIFGVTSGDNEVDSNDVKTTKTTSTTTTASTTTTTLSTTTPSTTTSTTTTSTTTSSTTVTTTTSPASTESSTINEFGGVSTEEASRMDVSKIIFSDDAINSRNKDLFNRVYVGRIPTTTLRTPDRRRNQNTNSQIFFPDK